MIDQLKELGELKGQGILTEEEFAAQKAKLWQRSSLRGLERRRSGCGVLLGDRQLGGRVDLEAAVGDRLAAADREAVGAVGEARLGALEGGQAVLQVLGAAGVELVLVEALGVEVAGLAALVALLRAIALDRGDLLLESAPARRRAADVRARSPCRTPYPPVRPVG